MATALPGLPESLQNDDSLLTKRFGPEVVTYYSGSQLNRYSFLRADDAFLRNAFISPTARFIILEKLNPLVEDASKLAALTFDDVRTLTGPEPFHLSEEEYIKEYDSTRSLPLLVFLGMHETAQSGEIASSEHGSIKGQPFFAIDLTQKGPHAESSDGAAFLKKQEEKGYTIQANPRSMSLNTDAAAIYAQARSMIDWNNRNPFCAGCGNPNLSVHAGYKRVCPPTDLKGGSEAQPRGECPTRHGVSNVCFPRTDPTMIAAVVSADGQRLLLGRQKRWPPHFYSTLAGFLEPGESIEESVRREVWEESGVKIGRVVIHSSQPWPYPASLMIGAIAQALPGDGEKVNLNDKELEYAKWYTITEVREALKKSVTPLDGPAPSGYKEGDLRLPPSQAIANRLITAVVEGFLTATPKI